MNFVSKYRSYILVFVVIGVIVYSPSFGNDFAFDDNLQIVNYTDLHNFRFKWLFEANLYNSGIFYRPITALYFSLLYGLFGQQALFYHLMQLGLHLIGVVLLFGLFLRFFSGKLAGFLSLIFLIHPINVESVAFISATNSELMFIPGLIALLLASEPNLKLGRITIIGVLLLVAFLSKEMGILFLFLIILYRYLYGLGKVPVFGFVGIIIGSVYFVMKILVGQAGDSAAVPGVQVSVLSLGERLINIPTIVIYYLKTVIWPIKLSVWQIWINGLNMQEFIMPLIICLAISFSVIAYLAYLYAKEDNAETTDQNRFRAFIFFLCWYVVGMVGLLHIIPLEMTVADRWFYFPLAGILGLCGVVGQSLWLSYQRHKRVYIAIVMIGVCLLAVRTFVRVMDWKDNVTLYSHDVGVNPESEILADELALALIKEKRMDEAMIYIRRAVVLYPNIRNLTHLGKLYSKNGQVNEAIEAYKQAIELAPKEIGDGKERQGLINKNDRLLQDAYVNMCATYIQLERFAEAKSVCEDGLKRYSSVPELYYNLAVAETRLGNSERAREVKKNLEELAPKNANPGF